MASNPQEQILDILSAHNTAPEASIRDTVMLDLTGSDADESGTTNMSVEPESERAPSPVEPGTTDDENMSSESEHESERSPTPVEIIDENDIYTDADIFDDGFSDGSDGSDGESSLDSMSTCYEELDDERPTVIRIVEKITVEDPPFRYGYDDDEGIDDDNGIDAMSESGISNWSASDADEPANTESEESPKTLQNHTLVRPLSNSTANPDPKNPKTFSQLESQKYKLLSGPSLNSGITLKSDLPRSVEELKGKIEVLEQQKQEAECKIDSDFENAGVSSELYTAYEAFCLSLNPEFGQRGGFSVTCHSPHNGKYIAYDPEFAMFKEAVEDEMPYNDRNFRAEASGTDIVEFWPLKCPALADGVETWGDQYPDLYELAIEAIRERKSEAAMEMLVRLPDMNSTLGGGWLFEYIPEPMLVYHPVTSMRWRFRSAHKIDSPVSVEGKRLRLQLMLQPDAIPN